MARALGESHLICYYCNDIVLPTCVPEWVIQAVVDGIILEVEVPDPNDTEAPHLMPGDVYRLQLPIEPSRLYNPFSGEKEDLSKWSLNATAGVPSNLLCYRDYYPTNLIIEEVNEPVKPEVALCPFANDLVIAGCRLDDPYGQVEPPYPGTGVLESGDPYIFYS